jgi:flagellar assembly protein FliH
MNRPLPKFSFDTVFDDVGAVAYEAPRPKRTFTPEEVEAIRARAYAEGERSAVVQAEQAAAVALRQVAAAMNTALQGLAHIAHGHKVNCAELSLACAKSIAGAALDQFPDAPAAAALATLIQELESAPRLIVRTSTPDPERLRTSLEQVAVNAGLTGQITVKDEPGMAHAAFVFDWGDGKAAYDPNAAAARVAEALQAALASEGLHGDPLPTERG